jgi:hypothetical protein
MFTTRKYAQVRMSLRDRGPGVQMTPIRRPLMPVTAIEIASHRLAGFVPDRLGDWGWSDDPIHHEMHQRLGSCVQWSKR